MKILGNSIFFMVLIGLSYGSPLKREKREKRDPYLEAGGDVDNRFLDAGLGGWSGENSKGVIFYGNSDTTSFSNSKGDMSHKLEIGLLKHRTAVFGNTEISNTIGATVAEVSGSFKEKAGVIVRPSLVEGSLHLGSIDANAGVSLDTGFMVGRGGVEAKLFGIGIKGGNDGAQLCVVVCFGLSWPKLW